LMPPTGEQLNHEALVSWVEGVAAVIADRIAPTAAGGTLVLMTGYERLRLLQAQLLAINGGELRERLIVQDRHVLPLSQALAEFRARAKEGARPILLGLGGAWTGIDLRDERYSDADAHKDLLLTDLVMPALPFGLNRTTTHEARVAWAGFAVEKDQALRSFLQGLGRLVRRDGLRHRRQWVLDGRLSDPLRRGMVSEFVRVVQDYPMRREFDVPLRGFVNDPS
jgi:CRISPR type IV-associated DEAD/DEAH-box helicase Csf4